MKKFLSVLLCLMLGVLLVVGFASCDEEAPPAPPVFKVNFIVDGTTQTTAEATGTEAITLPEEPTKKGYAFEGWFLDDGTWQQPFDASAPRSGDVSVYAKWVELPPPDLSISSQTLTLKDDKPTAPSRTGYVFLGWDYDFTKPIAGKQDRKGTLAISFRHSLPSGILYPEP